MKKKLFSRLRDAKLTERIFVEPNIRKVVKDSNFANKLGSLEKSAWFRSLKLRKFFWVTLGQSTS